MSEHDSRAVGKAVVATERSLDYLEESIFELWQREKTSRELLEVAQAWLEYPDSVSLEQIETATSRAQRRANQVAKAAVEKDMAQNRNLEKQDESFDWTATMLEWAAVEAAETVLQTLMMAGWAKQGVGHVLDKMANEVIQAAQEVVGYAAAARVHALRKPQESMATIQGRALVAREAAMEILGQEMAEWEMAEVEMETPSL